MDEPQALEEGHLEVLGAEVADPGDPVGPKGDPRAHQGQPRIVGGGVGLDRARPVAPAVAIELGVALGSEDRGVELAGRQTGLGVPVVDGVGVVSEGESLEEVVDRHVVEVGQLGQKRRHHHVGTQLGQPGIEPSDLLAHPLDAVLVEGHELGDGLDRRQLAAPDDRRGRGQPLMDEVPQGLVVVVLDGGLDPVGLSTPGTVGHQPS